MGLDSNFAELVSAVTRRPSYRDSFLPEVLTAAVATALDVTGVSLTLLSEDLRMPLGANDQHARDAEMVQFTLGDGPCIDTYRTGQPLALSLEDLKQRWPEYLEALTKRTPYRSVCSVPLDLGGVLVGAMDIYQSEDSGLDVAKMQKALHIGHLVARALANSPHADDNDPVGPSWLRTPAMHQRATAWIAIGLISRAADMDPDDSLDVIRSYALRQGKTIDEISYELASHLTNADDVLAHRT